MSQNPNDKAHFHLILCEVIFTANGELQILRKQMAEKSHSLSFNTRHLSMIQNRAASEVIQTLPADVQPTVKVLDVLITNIVYLGEQTDLEFFGEEILMDDEGNITVQDAVAADETPVPDNVTQFPEKAG